MTVTIRGDKELKAKLARLTDKSRLRPALEAGARDLYGYISPYPAYRAEATGGKSWYQRGYGQRWRRKDGSIGGRATSEQLGQRWTTRIGLTTAIIGNNASYAPYVHDSKMQARFHGARGWRTDKQGIDARKDVILDMVKKQVDRLLED